MIANRMKCAAASLAAAVLAGLMLSATISSAQDKKDKLDLDKIPKAVMDALKSKFPKPEITQWAKAIEKGDVIYDIEFTYKGRKCEMDVKEDGTIINIEREIKAKDLPAAVSKAVDNKYPKATLKEIMEIMAVKGKKEVLEGYEVVLVTADRKDVELTLAPDGKIVAEEVLGAKKEEKKKK